MNGEHSNPREAPTTDRELVPESQNGSHRGFRVEARYDGMEPLDIDGTIYTKEWKRVQFPNGAIGVPSGPSWHLPELYPFSCYSYQAAQALRWWLHAELEAKHIGGAMCFETRLVQYEITYSRQCKRLSEHGHIHGDDRSNIMPDWGKK